MGVDDFGGVMGHVGRGVAGTTAQAKESAGRTKDDARVVGIEAAVDATEGLPEEASELVFGGPPDGLSATGEFSLKDGVIEPPASDGSAMQTQSLGDMGIGVAEDE